MVTRQPWDDTVPVHVTWRKEPGDEPAPADRGTPARSD